MHRARQKLMALLRRTLVPTHSVESVSRIIASIPDKTNGGAFVVRKFSGPLVIEGRNGNLVRTGKLIEGSHDGLTRQKSSNFLAGLRSRPGGDFALSLHTPHATNYYHFLVHTLPRVIYAENAVGSLDFPIILSTALADNDFMQGAIELDFFGEHELIVQQSNENLRYQSICVVSPSHTPLDHVDNVLDRLNASGKSDHFQRVYIERGSGSPNGRNIRNSAQVSELLAAYDFETIDPQLLSLEQQIDTFTRARFIVSPHGAGLTNLLFRRGSKASVYEIFNHNLINHCYREISEKYGFDYKAAFSLNVRGKSTAGSAEIDCNLLEIWLKGCTE